jgi:hypothetical protein
MRPAILIVCLLFPVAAAAQDKSRFEVGGLFTYVFLEKIGSSDYKAGTGAGGFGGRFVYSVLPYLDIDADLIVHPNGGVSGTRLQGLFGVKMGKRFSRVGLFAKARPGFLYFSKDPFGATEAGSTPFNTNWASSLDASMDLGGVVEFYSRRGPIFRFDLGDTIVSYESRNVVTSQLEPPRSAGGFTTHNRQWSLGVSFPLR